MSKILSFCGFILLSLSACNNNTCASDDTECQVECPDCLVDGKKVAKVSVSTLAKDANDNSFDVDCEVQVGDVVGRSGDVLTVPAKGDELEILVGDKKKTTKDGFRIAEYDGLDWAGKAESISLKSGDDEQIEVNMNVVFSGRFACTQGSYFYDANAPDFKGEYAATADLGSQQIDVVGTRKIMPRTYSDFNFVDGVLYTNGRHIELLHSDYMFSTESWFVPATESSPFSWMITIVDTNGAVSDLKCVLED